jgi:hypothetical protein
MNLFSAHIKSIFLEDIAFLGGEIPALRDVDLFFQGSI